MMQLDGKSISKGTGSDVLDALAASDIPAIANDASGQLVFRNRAAEALLGRPADRALPQRCYDVLAGRDVFGNRFCYEGCPVLNMSQREEPIRDFGLVVKTAETNQERSLNVTILKLQGPRPETLLLVHLLRPADSRNPRAVPLLGLPTDGRSDDRRVAGPVGLNTAPGSAPRALTHRETEILGWVSAGLQNKEIAQELGISLFTIRNHVHNILEKLEVHSKLEAISLAFRRGWITLSSAPPPRTKVPERANRES